MVSKTATSELTNIEWFLEENTGTERWVHKGIRYEYPLENVTVLPEGEIVSRRNRVHARVCASITTYLGIWNRTQSEPRGEVLCGDAGFLLSGFPDSSAGIDIAYISAELAAQTFEDTTMIDGCPLLAAEVLSPNDKHKNISSKVAAYIDSGVPLVWIVDADIHTVTVHRPGHQPYMVNSDQELTGDGHLPGFRVKVADLFA